MGEICRLYKVKSLNNDDTKEAIKIFQEKFVLFGIVKLRNGTFL